MARFAVRRRRTPAEGRDAAGTGTIILGLAAGVAAGFALWQLIGPRATRLVRAPRTAPLVPLSVAELVATAQSALDADLQLRDFGLDITPIGRRAIALHGWVDHRRARARAERVVRDAVEIDRLVNGILVHGEDDLPSGYPVLDDSDAATA